MKAEKGEEVAEGKSEARSWFVRFKEGSCLLNIKSSRGGRSASGEDAPSYPEEPAKIINEGNYSKGQTVK